MSEIKNARLDLYGAEHSNCGGMMTMGFKSLMSWTFLSQSYDVADGGVQGYGAKHITLYDIRAELSKRYKDLRTAYHSPTVEECFNLLTKETPETFYIGTSVLVTVLLYLA